MRAQEANWQKEAECDRLEQLQASARRLDHMQAALGAAEAKCQGAELACLELRQAEGRLGTEEALLQRAAEEVQAEAFEFNARLCRLREQDLSRRRYWESLPSVAAEKLCSRREELRGYRARAQAVRRLMREHEAREHARQIAVVYLAESLTSFQCDAPEHTQVAKEMLTEHVALVRRLQARKCDLESRCDRERRERAALERRLEAATEGGSPTSSLASPARSHMRCVARTISRPAL